MRNLVLKPYIINVQKTEKNGSTYYEKELKNLKFTYLRIYRSKRVKRI